MTVHVPTRVPRGAELDVICYSHVPEKDLSPNQVITDYETALGLATSHDQKKHHGKGNVRVEIIPKNDEPLSSKKLRDRIPDDEREQLEVRHGDWELTDWNHLKGGPDD